MKLNDCDLNKLFCTFTPIDKLDETLDLILSTYSILYKKIFILKSTGTEELICTYNIDTVNVSDNIIIANTILTHRNKEHNVIYTVNALNCIIGNINPNQNNKYQPVNWKEYAKSILLTRKNMFTILPTEIYDIINLD